MTDILRFLLPVAMGAVAVVLIVGLWNMMRGGSANLSQTLMRWRVILQFVAILLVVAVMFLAGR